MAEDEAKDGEEGSEKAEEKEQKSAAEEPVKPYGIAKDSYPPGQSFPGDTGTKPAPLWLITFTDVMALMLTFFVMLYAMSVPKEYIWEKVADSISSKFSTFEFALAFDKGPVDEINIDRIRTKKALNLDYLQNLVSRVLENRNIEGVLLFVNGDRLIVSFPSELLFQAGRVDIQQSGKEVLFELGGVLDGIRNPVEVVGHSDPRPVSSQAYDNNWGLSLARAASVAQILKDVGYDRNIVVRGLSSGRFDEISRTVPIDQRYDLARRVDIVLMREDPNKFDF